MSKFQIGDRVRMLPNTAFAGVLFWVTGVEEDLTGKIPEQLTCRSVDNFGPTGPFYCSARASTFEDDCVFLLGDTVYWIHEAADPRREYTIIDVGGLPSAMSYNIASGPKHVFGVVAASLSLRPFVSVDSSGAIAPSLSSPAPVATPDWKQWRDITASKTDCPCGIDLSRQTCQYHSVQTMAKVGGKCVG